MSSKLFQQIQELRAAQAEAQILPTRRGGALTIPVGLPAEDEAHLVQYPVVAEGEVSQGTIGLSKVRLIGAKLATQELRADHPKREQGITDQHVMDLTFVCKGYGPQGLVEVRLLEDGEPQALPLETDVLAALAFPTQLLYGHHQGVHLPGAEALKEILLANGWVVRPELEGVDRKRTTVWNLQTRGSNADGRPNLREQSQLVNGALPVTSLTVRPTRWTNTENGETQGFADFVTASLENYARWLTNSMSVQGQPVDKQVDAVIGQGLTSLTGARTQADNDTGKLVTYLDRAGVAEFTLQVGDGDPVEVSFWESATAAAEGNAAGGEIPDDNAF